MKTITTQDTTIQSKCKAFVDLMNISSDDETTGKLFKRTSVQDMLPQQTDNGEKKCKTT